MTELDKTGLEAAARAICAQAGFDPDEIMANDGPRWRYYIPGTYSAVSAYLEALPCSPESAPDLLTALKRILNPAPGVKKLPPWVYGIAGAAISKAEGDRS